MKNNITVLDYDLAFTADSGWAKVQVFGQPIDFTFTQYDAVTAALELGLIQEPEDRDRTRCGYEKPAFSATVREVLPWESRIAYQDNSDILKEFAGTEFAEQIVKHLALQATEVRAAIQAEAERIALHECPSGVVEHHDIINWMHDNRPEFMQNFAVDFKKISDHKKQLWYEFQNQQIEEIL